MLCDSQSLEELSSKNSLKPEISWLYIPLNLMKANKIEAEIITPNISKLGFIKECNNIVIKQQTNIPSHSFRSSYWMEQTIKNYEHWKLRKVGEVYK